MKDASESALVSEVVRRSLANEWSPAALDVLVALFSADMSDEHNVAETSFDDTAEESACDDADCDYHQGRTPSMPPGFEAVMGEAIKLGPRREQIIDGRRYKRRDSGRLVALCDKPGCVNEVHSRGLCRRHGG